MLSDEREKEIRAVCLGSHLGWPGEFMRQLLAEIDSLRAELKDRESNVQELQKVAESWMHDCDKLRGDMHLAVSDAGKSLIAERDALKAEVDRLRKVKDGAYLERNKCLVLITEMALVLGLPAGRARHDPDDKEWEDDWRTVVYIDLPSGQVSWHFHDSQFDLVAGLPSYYGKWDGHSTEEKYKRVLDANFQCLNKERKSLIRSSQRSFDLELENLRLKERIEKLRETLKELAQMGTIISVENIRYPVGLYAQDRLTQDENEAAK